MCSEETDHKAKKLLLLCQWVKIIVKLEIYLFLCNYYRFYHPHIINSCTFVTPEGNLFRFSASEKFTGRWKTVVLHVQFTGIRIVVHAPGTLPNINENGINILPGQSTSLRVAMNKINHIDDPYSSCYDPPNPRSNTTLQTDLNSCRRMCLDKIIASNCSCEYSLNQYSLLWVPHQQVLTPVSTAWMSTHSYEYNMNEYVLLRVQH